MRTDETDPEVSWAGTALLGVTSGSLLTIWSGLWLFYLMRHTPEHTFWTYLASGALLTGLAFFFGGFAMGIVRRQTEEQADMVNS